MTRELMATPLALVEARRQEWAYQDLVPLGVPTILAGRGGIGKSTILAWLAAGLTRGEFPGDLYGRPASVGFISGEDDLATTLVPRLTAAGADMERVWDFSSVKTTTDEGDEWTGLPTIAEDLKSLKASLIEQGIHVLIIDPIVSLMSGDSIKASDVRRNLDPIAGLAGELGIAPILVMHFGKGQGNASDKVSGSHAFRDIARSVLLLAVDEETDQRILTVDKSNYSVKAPSLAFEVVSASVPTGNGDAAIVGRASLIGETTLTVHELVRRSDDANLGDLSSEILAYVNSSSTEVDAAAISEEFDIQKNQARVYLGRLVRSARIIRSGRGKYTRNSDNAPVTPVVSVASNYPNATAQQSICKGCGEPMTRLRRDQDTHPNLACEQLWREKQQLGMTGYEVA
ncbi:MAG: AAA family ATPase [Microbacteriaceae bacterium]